MSETKSAIGACELGAKANIKSVNCQPESGGVTQVSSRSSTRRIFPEMVLGKLARNWISLGYL